ncbi:glycosyltransferase family 4 protein [Microbacterium sp. B2969]|uniref:D-inositol 3-phosphate glycosyltransferase n=1 Tax=Microbacterium alkaliflavum TaxID=3248839 RepID=A0ABW7Q9P7_9MICO
MRVLVPLNSLELGGTQINAVDFADALRVHGIESFLVGAEESLGEGPSLLDYARSKGVQVRVYDAKPGLLSHGRQLTAIADELRVDLVHVYGMWGAARPVYWGPARLGRLPWVHTVYEMSVSHVVHRHMPLVVGTGYLLEELASRPGTTVLVSPPVDLASDSPDAGGGLAFRDDHALGDGPLLGIVSRLDSREKAVSIDVAIDAMRELAGQDATLFVVGGGDAEVPLRRHAEEVNAVVGREAVRFLGAMHDPRPAYAGADIMLGMGSSAARALAFGKPLIVQGSTGWSQLFEPATAAGLARSSYWSAQPAPDAVGDLTRSATALIGDADRRNALGVFGREFAMERFGLTAMTERIAQLYASAIDSYGSRDWLRDLPKEGQRLREMIARRIGPST